MYTEIKPVIPTYLVQTTKDSFCYVEAGRCTVDTGGTYRELVQLVKTSITQSKEMICIPVRL